MNEKFTNFLKLPSALKGITDLSLAKQLFCKSITVDAIAVTPKCISKILNEIPKDFILNLPRIRSIVTSPKSPNDRLILLGIERESFDKNKISVINLIGGELVKYELHIDYSYWLAEDVLKSIIPTPSNTPGSFEMAGHIAHLNLRDEHLPYRHIIGQVLLDKNPSIKTVVNKTSSISNTFRVFPMEVIGGVENFITQLKEQKCLFSFDFSKVYWNSRLQFEHERLVTQFKGGERICDVFAGVGPFSIPAVKNQKCIVYANDLNPESIHWLKENVKKNKIKENLFVFNQNASDFIKNSIAILHEKEPESYFDHYIMNLPASAPSFIEHFADLQFKNSPLVHCYLFVKDIDGNPPIDPVSVIHEHLPINISIEIIHVQNVRSVAPLKTMYCVSFKIISTCKKQKLNIP